MKKKQVIRINENQIRKIVTESVKRVLKEGKLVNNKPFFKNDNIGGKDILPGDEIWNQNYDYYSDPKTKDAAEKHDYRATTRQSKDELGNKPNNTVYEKNLIIKAFIKFMHGRPEFMNDELRYDPNGRDELLSNFSSMLYNKYGINIASYDLEWLGDMDWHNKKLYTTRIKRTYPEDYGDVSSSDSLSKLQKSMDNGKINEAITHAIRKVLG